MKRTEQELSRRRLQELWKCGLSSASFFEEKGSLLDEVWEACRRFQPSLKELCQFGVLFAHLGRSFAPNLPIDFPWLWCREEDYQEQETSQAIEFYKNVLRNTSSPLFQLDWHPFETKGIKGGVTFSGSDTSLGALISNQVQIRAFGPKQLPLSEPKGFGIRFTKTTRWSSLSTLPHIWFDVQVKPKEETISLDLSFFGLSPSEPIAFCFYVKAGSAKIGKEVIASGTLNRYRGKVQPILLGDELHLEGANVEKMEVIPLAGKGGFWDCDYLIAFEIHPLNPKPSFSLKIVNS